MKMDRIRKFFRISFFNFLWHFRYFLPLGTYLVGASCILRTHRGYESNSYVLYKDSYNVTVGACLDFRNVFRYLHERHELFVTVYFSTMDCYISLILYLVMDVLFMLLVKHFEFVVQWYGNDIIRSCVETLRFLLPCFIPLENPSEV